MSPGSYANTACAKMRVWRNSKAGNLMLDSNISHGLWTRMAKHLTQPQQLQQGTMGTHSFQTLRCWQDLTQLDLEDSSPVFIAFNLENTPSVLLS